MSTLTLLLCDHHDLIWNKGFVEHTVRGDGASIRPYAEREAAQFDRWLALLPGTEACYQIEQTLSIRQYLVDQPHRRDEIAALVVAGQIEFLGGGESVIDYNLVHGEAIYRNLLGSFRYLRETFGVQPRVFSAPDTFGLSAQLPQIARQFGLDWLPKFSRVFEGEGAMGIQRDLPHKPYWRGLDGSLLYIATAAQVLGARVVRDMQNHQYHPCAACLGAGCRLCGWSGLGLLPLHGHETAAVAVERMLQEGGGDLVITVDTEEGLKTPDYLVRMAEFARQHGIDLRCPAFTELLTHEAQAAVARLHDGSLSEADIDPRAEGNPVASGCAVSRSILKRENRGCEHLLLAAETWSALAATTGRPYPRDTLAGLWRLLNLSQFHDGITASHPDGPHHEQRSWLRQLRSGAGRLLLEACDHLAADIVGAASDDGVPVAVFNHLAWPLPLALVEVVLASDAFDPDGVWSINDWTCADGAGQPLPVLDWQRHDLRGSIVYQLTVAVRNLPTCGWTTITCQPQGTRCDASDGSAVEDVDEAAGLAAGNRVVIKAREREAAMAAVTDGAIANQRFRIRWDATGITAIDDLVLGRPVAKAGSFDLIAHDDIGSLWETLKHFGLRRRLSESSRITVRGWRGTGPCAGVQQVVVEGELEAPMDWELPEGWSQEMGLCSGRSLRTLEAEEVTVAIRSCRWRHELLLIDGDDLVRCRTTLNCDSENTRILLPLELGIRTSEDRALYEIPYGAIERPSYQPIDGYHCSGDGTWTALHFVAVEDTASGSTTAVFNRGIPAHRFADGCLELSLLRSPRISVFGRTNPGYRANTELARDAGEQVYEYALGAEAGTAADNDFARRGHAFNAPAVAIPLDGRQRCWQRPGTPQSLTATAGLLDIEAESVVVAAIKREEDGAALVLRCQEASGQGGRLRVPGHRLETICPLEDSVLASGPELHLRPWEIATVRLIPI